jgi:hypothetical protein
VLDPRRESPETFWFLAANLPVERITNAPDTQVEKLRAALHEMRHLVQITDNKPDHPQELDAELFARAVLRGQLSGLKIDPAKHLQVNLFARYTQLLTAPLHYQIAADIEAFEAGKKPLAGECARAVDKIYDSLIEKLVGKQPKPYLYDAQLISCFQKTPEVAYSLLRRCVEDGAFGQNPLAEHVSNKVLEAVEYFSEGLTRNPDVVNRIYPVQGLSL